MKKVLKHHRFVNAERNGKDVEKKMVIFNSDSNTAVRLTNDHANHFVTVSAEGVEITISISYDCVEDAEKLYDTIADWLATDEPTLCVETEAVKEEFSCGYSWRVKLKSINK